MDYEDLGRFAMASPDVEEFLYFRLQTPGFAVIGRPFAGLEKEGRGAVFPAHQSDAALVKGEPDRYEGVWLPGRVRSLVGIRVALDGLPVDHLHELIEREWRYTAPKKLILAYRACQASD